MCPRQMKERTTIVWSFRSPVIPSSLFRRSLPGGIPERRFGCPFPWAFTISKPLQRMPETPEQKARREIDIKLAAAGWLVQDRDALDLPPLLHHVGGSC